MSSSQLAEHLRRATDRGGKNLYEQYKPYFLTIKQSELLAESDKSVSGCLD